MTGNNMVHHIVDRKMTGNNMVEIHNIVDRNMTGNNMVEIHHMVDRIIGLATTHCASINFSL